MKLGLTIKRVIGASRGSRTHTCTGFKSDASANCATEANLVVPPGLEPGSCGNLPPKPLYKGGVLTIKL